MRPQERLQRQRISTPSNAAQQDEARRRLEARRGRRMVAQWRCWSAVATKRRRKMETRDASPKEDGKMLVGKVTKERRFKKTSQARGTRMTEKNFIVSTEESVGISSSSAAGHNTQRHGKARLVLGTLFAVSREEHRRKTTHLGRELWGSKRFSSP